MDPANTGPAFRMQPGREPIPGYRLLAPLGRGGFGEVWKCEAPGGLHKAVKFVQRGLATGREGGPADEELRAIHRVKSIRHPFLLSLERVELMGDELVIVMELADSNLDEVFLRQRAAGLPGIPRAQLLGYLRDAAEALDLMNLSHNLLHLDIKPQNLFVVCDRVKVGDFGLVHRLPPVAASQLAAAPGLNLTPIYAAPELFSGAVSPSADQYSLAIVYQQLLTWTRSRLPTALMCPGRCPRARRSASHPVADSCRRSSEKAGREVGPGRGWARPSSWRTITRSSGR
jgi:eukaryotic-like serine/threonine-protein kinase